MGEKKTGKTCESCKTAIASLFCHVDSAILCLRCDSTLHVARNKRHGRVWVCEQAPAMVTRKADAASPCATCDRDIHSTNPLARRHDRLSLVPFYDSPPPSAHYAQGDEDSSATRYLSDSEEAASWLLPNPNPKDELKPSEYLFADVDPYLDLDLMMGDQKPTHHQHQYATSAAASTTGVADGVVPVVAGKISNDINIGMVCIAPSMVEGVPCYDDMDYAGSKPFIIYNFNSQSITQSVSSSSLEVGVVPDHNNLADVSTTASLPQGSVCHDIVPLSKIDREPRVMRYREKRKNRKFEKTIRYFSRKAYAETRPRIKGRFAKRINGEYEVVPSF